MTVRFSATAFRRFATPQLGAALAAAMVLAWAPASFATPDLTIDSNAGTNASAPVVRNQNIPGQNVPNSAFIPADYSALVSESGPRPTRLEASPSVRNQTVSAALTAVLPASFELDDNGVSQSHGRALVSAAGDRPWPFVLADIARQAHFVAHIDWSAQRVSLAPGDALSSSSVVTPADSSSNSSLLSGSLSSDSESGRRSGSLAAAPVTATATPHSVVVGDSSFTPVTTPIHAPSSFTVSNGMSQMQSWPMNPSMTLRENVAVWAKKAGWVLVWEASDYPVVGAPVFHGAFDAPDGPIATIISGYEHSVQPLSASLTTMDHVLHITNKYAQRVEVPTTTPGDIAPQLYDKGTAPSHSAFGTDVSGLDSNVSGATPNRSINGQ